MMIMTMTNKSLKIIPVQTNQNVIDKNFQREIKMSRPLNPASPDEREQLRRLFLMKRTEVEMITQRGFNIQNAYMISRADSNYPVTDLSLFLDPTLGMDTFGEESEGMPFFLAMLQHRQQTGLFQSRSEFSSVYYSSDQQRRIVVLYLDNEPDKNVSKKYFEIVDFFVTQQFHEIILVTTTGLNADLSNRVRRMPNYKVEVFLDTELAFNRTKHSYAPISIRHIPNAQKAEWSKQEGLRPEKLPMMLDADMVAKWYGASPLDVFQVELLGSTTDTVGYSRIVRMTTPTKT